MRKVAILNEGPSAFNKTKKFIRACEANAKAIKKENEIFLIYKEIQMGSVAKAYMRRLLVIYDFATDPS